MRHSVVVCSRWRLNHGSNELRIPHRDNGANHQPRNANHIIGGFSCCAATNRLSLQGLVRGPSAPRRRSAVGVLEVRGGPPSGYSHREAHRGVDCRDRPSRGCGIPPSYRTRRSCTKHKSAADIPSTRLPSSCQSRETQSHSTANTSSHCFTGTHAPHMRDGCVWTLRAGG